MTTIYDAAILLVDDNPDLLTLVTDNLRTAGYKSVCTAADCAAARAAFAAHRPDLMILDINLPDGDASGYSAPCGQNRTSRRCFSRRGTPTRTGCSGWGLAQTTI